MKVWVPMVSQLEGRMCRGLAVPELARAPEDEGPEGLHQRRGPVRRGVRGGRQRVRLPESR